LRQPIPFGKYYLLERINVGGMAEVFKAKATGVEGFERMVAVKRILPSIAEDEEFITMFIDEAKIAVQLTHANIAQIFDLGKVDDSYFIALEYVHGKDLRAIFNRARARGEQLPIPMACYAIMKLCEGLDYAHNKRDAAGQFLNLVHRDVSPQNILVSHEGEVKIIDFGIAKAAGKAGRTQAGILKGKFGYMSPEQVQGLEIDRRSDVFGVGICLYELLTGERLFVGESDFATLEKVRNVDIMPPSTYNRRIPEELEQIVLKALARDRGSRHQTAMQLHDELQGFMYASGNFFGRRDLSMYMHRAFAEEIERETARDQEYAEMGAEERDDITGLTAFDEIDPVSTVSALNAQPVQAPVRAQRPVVNKSTLLGLPAAQPMPLPTRSTLRPPGAPAMQSRPSVPPLVPRPQSIPPSQALQAVGGHGSPRLEMDWDDEEMSTQIYDRPDESVPAAPVPAAPISGSFPPALQRGPVASLPPQLQPALPPTAPGAPSPFVAGPSYALPEPSEELEWERPERQRRPLLAAGLAVVVILGLIVGGLLLFRRPAPGTVHLSTSPPDVSVALDGRPVLGSSPFVISEIEPGVPHELTVSKQGYRTWSSRFELRADATMQLPPVSLELMESGFALDSVPSGAVVYVDGTRLAKTTPVRIGDLSPGDHQVRIEAEGHAPWESSLHVTPGTVLDLPTAQLVLRTGEAPPVAAATPAAPAAEATPPPVRAPAVRRGPRPVREPVARPAVARAEPEAEPEPEPEPEEAPASSGGGTGTLRVQTRPWSTVFVDGRPVGNTPLMGLELSAGRHTLTFVNDSFGIRKTVKVQIQAGQTLTQVLTLE
jgi:serine/threonine protein kinase